MKTDNETRQADSSHRIKMLTKDKNKKIHQRLHSKNSLSQHLHIKVLNTSNKI